jgi:hypothetical protein
MELLLLLAVLACPIVMGGTMLVMMRQMRGGDRSGGWPREDDSG